MSKWTKTTSVDLVIALGEGHEPSGDRASPAAGYCEAALAAADGGPPAEAGIARPADRH